MSGSDKEPMLIAQAKAGPMPDIGRPYTLAEFMEWRTAEDARMNAAILEAIEIEIRSACITAIDAGLKDLGYTLEERDEMMDQLLEELGQPR